jgi:hypothetical protein
MTPTCTRCQRERRQRNGRLAGRNGLCWACTSRERRGNPPRKHLHTPGGPCLTEGCLLTGIRAGFCWGCYQTRRRGRERKTTFLDLSLAEWAANR